MTIALPNDIITYSYSNTSVLFGTGAGCFKVYIYSVAAAGCQDEEADQVDALGKTAALYILKTTKCSNRSRCMQGGFTTHQSFRGSPYNFNVHVDEFGQDHNLYTVKAAHLPRPF